MKITLINHVILRLDSIEFKIIYLYIIIMLKI